MNNIFITIIIFCFLLPTELLAKTTQSVSSSGDTLLIENFEKLHIQVRIKSHEVSIGKPSDTRPEKLESSCTYSKYPCSMVDIIEILINGKTLFVPRSAFCSFADINTVTIDHVKHKFILTVNGGDASESYIGKIVFDQERVISRQVFSALAPDEVIEETHYKKQIETFD